VLPTDRAVGVTPAAVRASAGAAEHLPIARIPNLSSAIERFKSHNIWITGLEALPESKPYTEVDFKGRVCIVIGSEGHGLSSPVRKQCDNLVQLPMKGKVSSLNAGVAGAIALYEVLRQQN
jgi:23S rRNA (guanosine2251-2'-O)-methyltransferase